jgi:hypothetical protein
MDPVHAVPFLMIVPTLYALYHALRAKDQKTRREMQLLFGLCGSSVVLGILLSSVTP